MNCGECQYSEKKQLQLICVRFPPVPIMIGAQQQPGALAGAVQVLIQSVYPQVEENGLPCGEFKAMPEFS